MCTEEEHSKVDKNRTAPRGGGLLWISVFVVVGVLLMATMLYFAAGERQGGNHLVPLYGQPINGGYRFVFSSSYDSDPRWGDIVIQVSDGENTAFWNNQTTKDLTSGHGPVTWHFGSAKHLGGLEVWLNLTDIAGDGLLKNGDYLDITIGGARFSPTETYTLNLLYEPTGGSLLSFEFTG